MSFYLFSHKPREEFAIHSQRAAGWQRGCFRTFEQYRAEHSQFILKQARGAVREVRAERIRTNEFSQIVGLMRSRLDRWAHFIESDFQPALGSLPGGFAASQPPANNYQVCHKLILPF